MNTKPAYRYTPPRDKVATRRQTERLEAALMVPALLVVVGLGVAYLVIKLAEVWAYVNDNLSVLTHQVG